jgi:hypothetical protein
MRRIHHITLKVPDVTVSRLCPKLKSNHANAYYVVTRVLFFAAEAMRQKRKTSASEKEKTATTEATTTPVKD